MTHLTKLGTPLPDGSSESELLPELVVPALDSPPPAGGGSNSKACSTTLLDFNALSWP